MPGTAYKKGDDDGGNRAVDLPASEVEIEWGEDVVAKPFGK